jgi:hypothetical protein
LEDAVDRIIGKLLEPFGKYPDPMRAEHMADLLSCEGHRVTASTIYRLVHEHPKDIPHMWVGKRKLLFPKVQVIPWWLGQRRCE